MQVICALRLLELGFEHFVRVGSLRKIHKKIAPYVLQHQDCQTNSSFLKQVTVILYCIGGIEPTLDLFSYIVHVINTVRF
jgi:hypothetical protein